ncbi:vesicular glutamate transporter 1 isoform X2 [Ischnura elegans]|uniref:vesicular glutamate transporter 1 isoform X2 n=1 Tax=Ischnura elegans TaxID=197161 RepID=UPI001ED88B8A|nr:vesicular glutamate transporter 1 isoform X2 [Ischnura elegans]
MPGFGALTAIKEKAASAFGSGVRYEEFEMPTKQRPSLGGLGESKDGMGGYPAGDGAGTPDSLPEPERPPLRHIDKYIRPECPCLSKRYTIAVLTCIGFIISFGMRCNMGMAKLQFEHKVKFNWTVGMESAVDSSFFWGYLVTQVPGGFLASKYPANRIFGTAIATSSFLNLLVPGATMLHPTFVIIVRIMQGLVEGVTYPACHGIWRFWAPPLERSRLATLAFCGSYAGVVLGMPLSGILTGGISWQAPFYFYGVVGLIWYLFWLWLSFEKPSKHPTISAKELLYIENSLGSVSQIAMPTIHTTPWKKFFSSMPVYAIIVANFCRSWNFYLLVLFQASYLQTFHFRIEETGLLGALPHLLMTVIVPCGGLLADHVRKTGLLTTTNVRKVFNCGGFGMEAIFFLVVAYAKTATAATIALTFGVAFSGFAISGFNVNHLDIAPRYASILMGMSNGIGTIAGLICPIAIDNITKDHTRESWKTVFIMAATVHFFGVAFYGIFASGELQPWAEPTDEEVASWNPIDAAKNVGGTDHKPIGPPGGEGDPGGMNTNAVQEFATWPDEPNTATGWDDPPAANTAYGQQTSLNSRMTSYGSLEDRPPPPPRPVPPIPYSNHVEPIQPGAHDQYMHGTISDRTY